MIFVSAPNGVIYASRIAYPHGIVHLDSYVDNKDIVMSSQAINEQGKTVDIVSIRNKVFFNNKDIERLVVSRFIKSFTPSQFEGCLNLSAIAIPTLIKKIPANCFKGCIKLKDIYYEGGS